jgi:hypothetical protein
MTGAGRPVGDVRLERRYRRLLLAYPRRFRHEHGAAIVTTLVEMAEPGRTRPAVRDAWHLCASGVRQRFRLPASPSWFPRWSQVACSAPSRVGSSPRPGHTGCAG